MSEEPKQLAVTQPTSDEPITAEPEAVSMNEDTLSLSTYNDNESGYKRESNECTEFFVDLFTCFGLLGDCCPLSGEGCLTNTGIFIGNLCVSCCKC